MLQAHISEKHSAVFTHLTYSMFAQAPRTWFYALRPLGFVVPASRLMDRGRTDIINAIIHDDHTTPEGGYNAQPQACFGAYAPAQRIAGSNAERAEASPREYRLGEYTSVGGAVGRKSQGIRQSFSEQT